MIVHRDISWKTTAVSEQPRNPFRPFLLMIADNDVYTLSLIMVILQGQVNIGSACSYLYCTGGSKGDSCSGSAAFEGTTCGDNMVRSYLLVHNLLL